MVFSRTASFFFLQFRRVNAFNYRCFRRAGSPLALALRASGQRASGASIAVTSSPRRRLSSTSFPDSNDEPSAEEILANYLGFLHGLRKESYLNFFSLSAEDSPAKKLLFSADRDAFFLLAYNFSPVRGKPSMALLEFFVGGVLAGRHQARSFFHSPEREQGSASSAGALTALVLLCYRQAFHWSQTLSQPPENLSQVSPETLHSLANEVSREFQLQFGEHPLLSELEGHLAEGLTYFGLREKRLTPLPASQREDKRYILCSQVFGCAYEVQKLFGSDWDSPTASLYFQRLLAPTMARFDRDFLEEHADEAALAVNLGRSLAHAELDGF